jgi:hypothetical protein
VPTIIFGTILAGRREVSRRHRAESNSWSHKAECQVCTTYCQVDQTKDPPAGSEKESSSGAAPGASVFAAYTGSPIGCAKVRSSSAASGGAGSATPSRAAT